MSEETTGTPSIDESNSPAGFESLSELDGISFEESNDEPTGEAAAATEEIVAEEKKEEIKTEEEVEDKSKEESKDKSEEEVEDKTLGGDEKEEKKEPKELGDDSPPVSKEGDEDGDDENTFQNFAKELGYEAKENTLASFKEAQEEFIDNKVSEATKESFNEQIASLKPEEQTLMLALNEGVTLDEYQKPFKEIDDLKSLDDAELVERSLKAEKYPQDLIDHKLEKLAEEGGLEMAAKEVRFALDTRKQEIESKNAEDVQTLIENNMANHQAKLDKETASMRTHIETVDMFMDSPLGKKGRDVIMKGWESGKYHELMKDPKAIVAFALYHEYGEKAMANIKNSNYEKGRDEKVDKLHNVPPTIGKGGSQVSSESGEPKEAAGNWGGLE